METIKASSFKIDNVIEKANDFLKQGKVVIFPTDTVYGLLADATNKKAIERIFKVKKREKSKPLPIFIKNISQAKKLAKISKKQEDFLKKAWPGKTTVVLKLKTENCKLKIYGAGQKTIALRIPKHQLVLGLLKRTNKPLTGTSANISGRPPSGNIKEILKQFKGQKNQPDLVVDSGKLRPSRPSTVVDLTSIKIKVLRK